MYENRYCDVYTGFGFSSPDVPLPSNMGKIVCYIQASFYTSMYTTYTSVYDSDVTDHQTADERSIVLEDHKCSRICSFSGTTALLDE